MAKGGRPLENPSSTARGLSRQQNLADIGITHNQSSKFQRLAAVPEAAFEQAVKAPRATATGIIAAHSGAFITNPNSTVEFDNVTTDLLIVCWNPADLSPPH